jgi:hypothetical protein
MAGYAHNVESRFELLEQSFVRSAEWNCHETKLPDRPYSLGLGLVHAWGGLAERNPPIPAQRRNTPGRCGLRAPGNNVS